MKPTIIGATTPVMAPAVFEIPKISPEYLRYKNRTLRQMSRIRVHVLVINTMRLEFLYQSETGGKFSVRFFSSLVVQGRLFPKLMTLDLSPSRAGQHIGQCVSSNHLCSPPHREHLSTSAPIHVSL